MWFCWADLHFQIVSSVLKIHFHILVFHQRRREKQNISNKIFWACPLFTSPVVTRSRSWSWSNCTVTLSISGARSITRAGSWRNWRESLPLYCPGCLSNTSPYGGPGASCLFWFTSSIFLCRLSFLCLFIFLSLSSFHHHPIYSLCLPVE